jgi:NitT/TauT family transport system permease protein
MTSIVVTVLNILTGFLEVSKDKIKLVETFGGTKRQILQKVVLPASVPAIVNALKVSVGLSFVGVIVGEFLVAKAGLGFLIVYGSQVFKMDWVMMSVIILCLLAAFLYIAVAAVEKRLMRGR